ncbi:MAG: GNAT family N-acetyltransferase [Bacilli bacterium]
MYNLVDATNLNLALLKDIKMETILANPNEFGETEIEKLKEYADMSVKEFLDLYKIIIINDSIAGIFLVREFEDGVLLDEIYLYDEYRNKGIGTNLINSIEDNNIYLWVYQNNTKAIKLYNRLGFNIIETTETRYKMKKEC